MIKTPKQGTPYFRKLPYRSHDQSRRRGRRRRRPSSLTSNVELGKAGVLMGPALRPLIARNPGKGTRSPNTPSPKRPML